MRFSRLAARSTMIPMLVPKQREFAQVVLASVGMRTLTWIELVLQFALKLDYELNLNLMNCEG